MIKLLLVDDEPLVRDGITDTFDWKRYDVEIVGIAANGIEAVMEKLMKLETLEDLKAEIKSYYAAFIKKLEAIKGKQYKNTAIEVKKYIEDNFQKDINLKTVSLTFSINSSYLSRIFSVKTGLSFTEYITDCRMNHAKKLLGNSDYTIHQISNMIGYNSEKYFSRLFKKRQGVTPQKYRTSLIKQLSVI